MNKKKQMKNIGFFKLIVPFILIFNVFDSYWWWVIINFNHLFLQLKWNQEVWYHAWELDDIIEMVSNISFYLVISIKGGWGDPWIAKKVSGILIFGDGVTHISGTSTPFPIAGWRRRIRWKYRKISRFTWRRRNRWRI